MSLQMGRVWTKVNIQIVMNLQLPMLKAGDMIAFVLTSIIIFHALQMNRHTHANHA